MVAIRLDVFLCVFLEGDSNVLVSQFLGKKGYTYRATPAEHDTKLETISFFFFSFFFCIHFMNNAKITPTKSIFGLRDPSFRRCANSMRTKTVM